MKILKRFNTILLAAIVAISGFAPVTKVLADPEPPTPNVTVYGTGDKFISFDLNGHQDFTVNSVTINGDSWTPGEAAEYHTTNDQYTVVVKITPNGDKKPTIGWGGNWNGFASITSNVKNENQYTITISVNNANHMDDQDPTKPTTFMGFFVEEENNWSPGNDQGNEPHFDGNAYVLWSCQSGGICMHHFDDIPNFDDGNSKFYKDTAIVDQRTGEHFNVNAQYKGWSTNEKYDNWVTAYKQAKGITGDINWADVKPEDMIGDPIDIRQYEANSGCTTVNTPQDEYEACVNAYAASKGVLVARAQLQPLGEPKYKNAYVSYGDRNFKTVIYNSNYKGVTIGSLDDLHYYTSEWENPFLRRDQYDISGTTKAKPTTIDTNLLEKIVNIKEIDANGFEITKIEALDVPSNAVKINKVDGEWRLEFSSNFYDHVVFKVTDSNNEVSYLQIKRTTIDAYFKHENNKPVINADFFFDKEKSYTDFEMTAVIVYKNGKEKNIKLTPHKGIDDGLGNITDAYEVLDGKGLKKATFQYPLSDGEDRTIQDIYLNVEYKGSTNSKYAGSFAGSGRGVQANIYHGEDE